MAEQVGLDHMPGKCSVYVVPYIRTAETVRIVVFKKAAYAKWYKRDAGSYVNPKHKCVVKQSPSGQEYVIYYDRDGCKLLPKKNPGKFCLSGGGCEAHETIVMAAIREFREETGYDLQPIIDRSAASACRFVDGTQQYFAVYVPFDEDQVSDMVTTILANISAADEFLQNESVCHKEAPMQSPPLDCNDFTNTTGPGAVLQTASEFVEDCRRDPDASHRGWYANAVERCP